MIAAPTSPRLTLRHLDTVEGASFGQLLDANEKILGATLQAEPRLPNGRYDARPCVDAIQLVDEDGQRISVIRRGNLLSDCEGGIVIGGHPDRFGDKRGVNGSASALERVLEAVRRQPFALVVE